MYGAGIVFNLICILVFAMIVHAQQRNEGHMFYYLFVKSVCDCTLFLFLIFETVYLWFVPYLLRNTYIRIIWRQWFKIYFVSVLQLASVYFEIAATFNCFITINKHLKRCMVIHWFYIITVFIFLFCSLFNLYQPFELDIFTGTLTNGFKLDSFYLTPMSFAYSATDTIFKIVSTVLRDALPLLLILILNGLILWSLRQATQRKHKIQNNSNVSTMSSISSPMLATARRAERMKVLMIVMTGVNLFMDHVFAFSL